MTTAAPTTVPVFARGCIACGEELAAHATSCDTCGSVMTTQPVRAELLIEALHRDGFTELKVF